MSIDNGSGSGPYSHDRLQTPICAVCRKVAKSGRWALWLALFLLLPFGIRAQSRDPWYFQTDSDYRFLLPDKAQHFYGSELLSTELGVPLALARGLAWEFLEASQGDFVSRRDLAADALGAMAAKLPAGRVSLLWNTERREVWLRVTVPL